MTITQLQYILAVAEHRNFTVAAEKCFVTQPTLSMQIQKLEEELDVKIFDRNKKPIQLTAIGQALVKQAQNIVNESERIKDIVEQEKGYIGGEFRMGIIPTVMPTLLPMFLGHFIKKYPEVQLIVKELTTDEIILHLENGLLDVAIAATPLSEPNIEEKPLYYEPFVGYFPNHTFGNREIEAEDIDVESLLLLKDGHCFTNGILNICKSTLKESHQTFQLESGSFETLIKLSNEGLGTTLLPYLHTKELPENEQKNLVHFANPKPSREISLLHPKNQLKLHIIEVLHKSISEVIRGAIAFHDVQIISPKKS